MQRGCDAPSQRLRRGVDAGAAKKTLTFYFINVHYINHYINFFVYQRRTGVAPASQPCSAWQTQRRSGCDAGMQEPIRLFRPPTHRLRSRCGAGAEPLQRWYAAGASPVRSGCTPGKQKTPNFHTTKPTASNSIVLLKKSSSIQADLAPCFRFLGSETHRS